MSTEIDELEKRVAALEARFPAICPDSSIPWGGGYEAIRPEEAREGDEYLSMDRWWKSDGGRYHPREPRFFPWRRRKSPAPAEPAPGSDADHPPVGYRLEPVRGKVIEGISLVWFQDEGPWTVVDESTLFQGDEVLDTDPAIANPIPANEGDSRLAESGEEWQEAGLTASMMWDVIQLMRKTLDCDGTTTPVERAERVMRIVDELRATVERLEAELETTKCLLVESLVERNRLKNLHDARKVRIEGFRDVLREAERVVVPWGYCPECGSDRLQHEEGEHKQCKDCHQEWYSDIDYTDVVRQNLCEGKDALRTISVPASRVFKDGEVAVREAEWEAAGNLLFSARAAWVECETSGECDMSAVTKAAKAWDALRAQGKEGAT